MHDVERVGRREKESERERERGRTRADRRRRRPSCAADCTTKGAIMRPSSNHRAFCPPFDPSTPLEPLKPPPYPEISTVPGTRAAHCEARQTYHRSGHRRFLFKCAPSTSLHPEYPTESMQFNLVVSREKIC